MVRQKKLPPKKYPVKVSVSALQNIDEKTAYIAFVAQQPLNAVKVGDKLMKTFDRIAASPMPSKSVAMFPPRPRFIGRSSVFPGTSFSKSLQLKSSSLELFTPAVGLQL